MLFTPLSQQANKTWIGKKEQGKGKDKRLMPSPLSLAKMDTKMLLINKSEPISSFFLFFFCLFCSLQWIAKLNRVLHKQIILKFLM